MNYKYAVFNENSNEMIDCENRYFRCLNFNNKHTFY